MALLGANGLVCNESGLEGFSALVKGTLFVLKNWQTSKMGMAKVW